MKYPFGFLLAFIMSAGSVSAQKKVLVLKNSLAIERKDESITLKRTALEKKIGKISTGKFVQLKSSTGQPLVVQYDDLNKDNRMIKCYNQLKFQDQFD